MTRTGFVSLTLISLLLISSLLGILVSIAILMSRVHTLERQFLQTEALARSGMAFAPDVWNAIPYLDPNYLDQDLTRWPKGYALEPYLPHVQLYKDRKNQVYSLATTTQGYRFLYRQQIIPFKQTQGLKSNRRRFDPDGVTGASHD